MDDKTEARCLFFGKMDVMSQDRFYQACRSLFTPVFKSYLHPKIINADRIPEEGPVILAGNHKHALDPILVDLCTKRTVHALAKSELFEGPFAFFFSRIGAIPVYLDAARNPDAYASAKKELLNGEVINISPEAARNYTKEILLPFKKGAVRLAKETGTRILPYCITGEYKYHSKDLKIVFGDMIMIEDEDIEEANRILFEAIRKLLEENRDV